MKNRLKTESPQKKSSNKSLFKGLLSFKKDERLLKIAGLLFITISLFLFLSFISYLFAWKTDQSIISNISWDIVKEANPELTENWMGLLGALVSHYFINNWFGIASFLIIPYLFLAGFKLLFNIRLFSLYKTFLYSAFLLAYISLVTGFVFYNYNIGGAFGYHAQLWIQGLIGKTGTVLFIIFLLLGFISIAFNLHLSNLVNFFNSISNKYNSQNKELDESFEKNADQTDENESFINDFDEETELGTNEETVEGRDKNSVEGADSHEFDLNMETAEKTQETDVNRDNSSIDLEIEAASGTEEDASGEFDIKRDEYDPKLDLSNYKYPELELLDEYDSEKITIDQEELEDRKNLIIDTLKNYKIEIDKIKATVGPTVTLYEIVPAAGIRISKIKNLEDDIALSLSALGIRIIAPIPGKGTIGIEVPNNKPEMVSIRSVISTSKFQKSDYDLPVAFGKTISNEVYVADLTKMPHLLMAGATGQGKSVGLNTIITSLLYKKHPSQVKFVLVDPKKVELTLYRAIEKHFLAKLPDNEEAIINDNKQVVKTLISLCQEMDQRYDLLKNAKVRNIKEYNKKFINRQLNPQKGHRYLPYIVLVIDELADLMMTAGKEVETPIARLAQLARAIGIHLILATQRPSVNIITGTIKANFPARLAFRVTSKVDSRTILDTGGADQLIGRGDMLLSAGSEVIRLQCAYVDTDEVGRITEFIGDQQGYPDAHLLPEVVDTDSGSGSGELGEDDMDELFEEAAHLIVKHQQGSTSLLQRRLKLGYNRAGRIIDQLEQAGIIGPFEGSKAREVLITDEYALEQFLSNLKDKNNN